MAKILIEPTKARLVLSQQDSLENTLNKLSQEVDSVRGALRYKIAGQQNITQCLREAAEQLSKESQSTHSMRSGLEQIIARYEQTENSNTDRIVAEKMSMQSGGGANASFSGDDDNHSLADWLDKLKDLFPWSVGPSIPGIDLIWPAGSILWWLLDGGYETETKVESGVEVDFEEVFEDKNAFKKFDKIKKDNTKVLKDSKFYWDPKTGEKTYIDPNDEKAMEEFTRHNKGTIPVDVTLLGVGGTASKALWDTKGSASGSFWGAEGEAAFSKVEGTAEAHLALLGVGASLGASYTAFSASEKAYLGSEDYNVYEEIKVEAGRVGAKGEVDVGLIDKEGNFNPSLYAGAKAEAIAGEVSGKVGAKVGGVDVGLEGSLNYGIGAHANVGIHDGKISVDIGATLGVGASVKLDIDVSGAVNAIGEAAGNFFSGVKGWLGW